MLEGLKVIELATYIAAPGAGGIMADWGADVIKIEPPGGDPIRQFFASVGIEGVAVNPVFELDNRGKRGIVLNLKTPRAQEAFRRLASRADVVIENYRPGVMRSFGLEYESLAANNPGLIYASISGYGHTGPDASKGGFDLVAQGVSGLMSITGEAGRPPVKVGVPVTDLGAGLFALAACGGQERDPRPIPGSWFADVAAVGQGGHSGFAVVSLLLDGEIETRANVTLTGGSAGGVHPWFIHEGTCASAP